MSTVETIYMCQPVYIFQMYGSARCEPSQMVTEATRKKELCEDILSVLSILVPGMNLMKCSESEGNCWKKDENSQEITL